MKRPRRWLVATFVAASIAVESAPGLAQDPGPGKAEAGAREKAAGKGKARLKPRRKAPVGVIVPYPFPPALIIRQTPEAHDEVRALLDLLRYH